MELLEFRNSNGKKRIKPHQTFYKQLNKVTAADLSLLKIKLNAYELPTLIEPSKPTRCPFPVIFELLSQGI